MEKREDLAFVKELVEQRKLKTIIDRCFPLAQAAEAHRYIEMNGMTGAIVRTFLATKY